MIMNVFEPLSSAKEAHQSVCHWLDAFQAAVRSEEYHKGRALFDESVISFGTIRARANSLDDLIENQWKLRWPQNVDFTFIHSSGLFIPDESGGGTVLILWSTKADGEAEGKRHGRATLLLRQFGDKILCVHSHFSLVP